VLTINKRNIVVSLLSLNIILLLAARFLKQLPSVLGLAFVCDSISGVSLTAAIIIVLQYVTSRLLEERFTGRRVHYAALISLNMAAGASISNFVVLPLIGLYSSPNTVVSLFANAVLLLGMLAFVVSVTLSFLCRFPSMNKGNVSSIGDATFYRGKSIVFKMRNKNVALCILKLASHLVSPLPVERRRILHNPEEGGFDSSGSGFLPYSHLSSLWNNVPDFGVEFTTESGLASIRFFTLAIDSVVESATKTAEAKAEKLKSILQARFNARIEFLQGHALWVAYGSILGSDPSCSIETRGGHLRIEGPQQSGVRYVSVSALRSKAESTSLIESAQPEVEKLISAFTKERIAGSMVIHLEAISPPAVASEAKLLKKAKNDPDLRVLLELGEKKREVSEERNAQLTGYWKVSAYLVYRGETSGETKMFQEKGDACIEAIYSSPGGRVKCEKLKGRAVAKHLNNLLFRQEIGVTMMRASSRLAAALIQLPEQNMPGIQETTTPDFQVPPREELENGDVAIGEVMSGENEICPLRLKPEDLMLHTVIFGETGFGKTRLIMKLLQAAPIHKVAWTIIEMKGEYRPLTKLIGRVVYLKPGSKIAPLNVSLFDPQMENPEIHAKKIFTILKETFSTLFTDQNRDLSAQMERVFYESLVSYITSRAAMKLGRQRSSEGALTAIATATHSNEETTSWGNWETYNDWLKNYAEKHGLSSMPQINSTIQALLNRLNSFTRSPLSDVFNHHENNTNFDDLVKRRAIIDLSEIKRNGTSEDLRLISNIITKYVATAAQKRGIQDELKHLLIIDDALDIVPEILTKKTTAETTITEQMVLLLRTTGQGVIIATQRPNISQNIVANAATKIFLRTTVDGEKAAKWLNLNEEQSNYLKTMPKREAIITTPRYSGPIRIRTFDIDPPKVTDEEIIMNNMVNYPVIYDKGTKSDGSDAGTDDSVGEDPMEMDPSPSETKRLTTIAEEALQAGDYKEALRTYIKAIETMKKPKQKGKPQHNQGVTDSQIISITNPSLKNTDHMQQSPPQQSPPTEQPLDQHVKVLPPPPHQIQRNAAAPTTTNPHSTDPPETSEENQMWQRIKRAFKHQQEIIDETTLQTRLNMRTTQQLRNQTESLISQNLIGEIIAPNYMKPAEATRIYYQITDHESRNIMQEYIITTIHKDLQSKGVNTRWVDNDMELLVTNQNQLVITTWTSNNIDQNTTIAKLTRIKQELQFEQPRELVIITPWMREAHRIQKIITRMELQGIMTIPFNENQTSKLVNHLTMGTPM
jgi:ribosomal protein S20